jgi:hypothetical protein
MGVTFVSLTLGEERRLRVLDNRMLRQIFGPTRGEVIGHCRQLHGENLNWRRMKWTRQSAGVGRGWVRRRF